MATVSKWTPFGVALDITATSSTVTRTSATQYTVKINASWETYYSGATTNYGMIASSGGSSATINTFGKTSSSGSGSFIGTYSISGNGSATKTITVTFKNFNSDNGKSATKTVSFNITVPAWTSYKVTYNANGGSGAPTSQTKWKDQTLTLSTTKPTKSGYTFLGWSTSSTATTATYSAGGNYTTNAAVTLYAIWRKTLTLSYNANGGSGSPTASSAYVYNSTTSKAFTVSSTKPTRTGYTFLGWSKSSTATAASYSSGSSITISSNTTLYAVWKIAYVDPKITNYSVKRCDENNTITDQGTYALVTFKWSTFSAAPTITITWTSTDGSITGSTPVTVSGTSGTVIQRVGNGTLTTDASFTITATVNDGSKSIPKTGTINSLEFPIEAIYENGMYGVAFGKTAEHTGYADINYKTMHRNHMEFVQNDKCIYGTAPDGETLVQAFCPQNTSGNTVIGHGNYSRTAGMTNASYGNTNIYGHDIQMRVSNVVNDSIFRPYRRRGDTITSLTLRTSGYITNGGTYLEFWIPFALPIVGGPTVTVTCGSGFILRQGNKYICGSSSDVSITPTSMSVTATFCNGVFVRAVFSDTTNVTNNDTVGIYWNGNITFS